MYFNTVQPLIQRASQQLCIFLSTAKDHIFPSILAQNDLAGKKINAGSSELLQFSGNLGRFEHSVVSNFIKIAKINPTCKEGGVLGANA